MRKIAIVGNIASGKSTVEKILQEMGFLVFDTDKIAHEILEKSVDVQNEFKNYDIYTDNKIDRKKLSKIVFSDSKKLKKLESIIHPEVKKEILKIFNENLKIVFISVPQLFEAKFENLFDLIIYIASDKNIRVERLMARNKMNKEDALQRINAQIADEEKIKRSNVIIENNGSLKELRNSVNNVLKNQHIV